jgi:hypothetical protein
MITAKKIEQMVSSQLPVDDVEFFMTLYAALPFAVRQACAEQLVAQSNLVPLLYALLQNEEAFAQQYIDEVTFLTNERTFLSTFNPA